MKRILAWVAIILAIPFAVFCFQNMVPVRLSFLGAVFWVNLVLVIAMSASIGLVIGISVALRKPNSAQGSIDVSNSSIE